MCSLRETVQEYVTALEDTEKKIQECPSEVRQLCVAARPRF